MTAEPCACCSRRGDNHRADCVELGPFFEVPPMGWLVVDKVTRKLDWDGELHDTEQQARDSLTENAKYQDADWKPFELYDIVPVYAHEFRHPA